MNRHRRRGTVAALIVLALALAACSSVEPFTDLTTELGDAGFDNPSVFVLAEDPAVLTVRAGAPAGKTTAEGHDAANRLVWTRYPRRFERLRVTIDGERRDHTRAQLAEALGPRPEGLEDGSLDDDVGRLVTWTVVGLLGLGLGGLAFVGLIVLLVVRSRRRSGRSRPRPVPLHPAPWAPAGHPPAGAPGPAPVPPPGGWTPAAPGAWAPPAPGATPPPPATWAPSPTASPADDLPPADARQLGRRPRGPRPPATQLPPGWGT